MTAIMILPGALGGLEGSALGAGCMGGERVAWLDYRPEDNFESLMARIGEAADALGSEPFDLIGQSYGGWIAQCVAGRWPTRVRRLVLSHTFALEPADARIFAFGEHMLRILPAVALAPLLRMRIRRALEPVRLALPDLYRRQDAALAQAVRSPRLLATLAAQQRCLWESLAVTDPGRAGDRPVLIIESANDPLIGARARARLRDRFPGAQVHCFPRAGHVSAVVEPEVYAALVEGFLHSPTFASGSATSPAAGSSS